MSESFMSQFLAQFRSEMQDSGCLDVPGLPRPTLVNGISPIYGIHRWARGYGQHTRDMYQNMEPSLRLASLMVKEVCMLAFYTHLTCGRPTTDPLSGKVYVAGSRAEHTSEGRATTLRNFRNLGEMITLMFVPRDYYNGGYYGATYMHREDIEWIRKFHSSDLPPIPDQTPRKIVIVLSPDFQDFFLHGFRTAPMAQRYRMWMLFTSTLAHETAHAYNYFLNRGMCEPHWSRHDKKSELGFAWETTTLGRIINPIFSDLKNCHALTSFQSENYVRESDRRSIFENVIGRVRRLEWRRVNDSQGRAVQMTPSQVRGDSWFGNRGRSHGTISVVHALPMWWIVTWFSEEEWNKKRRTWRDHGTYTPPSLGNTFILLHEQGLDGNTCLRIPQTSRAEFDPYLSTVRAQAQAMHLYEDNYSGDYNEIHDRSHSGRNSSRTDREHSRPGRDQSSSGIFILEGIPADFWEPVIPATSRGGNSRPGRGRSNLPGFEMVSIPDGFCEIMNSRSNPGSGGRRPSQGAEYLRSGHSSGSPGLDIGAIMDDFWGSVALPPHPGGRSGRRSSHSGQRLTVDDFALDDDDDYLDEFEAFQDGFLRGFGRFDRRS